MYDIVPGWIFLVLMIYLDVQCVYVCVYSICNIEQLLLQSKRVYFEPNISDCGPGTQVQVALNDMFLCGSSSMNFYILKTNIVINPLIYQIYR